jgi:hypothetical protein
VQTASTAENAASLVRDTRNTPATDSTSTAPPTVASADPLTVTWTVLPTKRPALLASGTPGLPGSDGEDDEPLQAVNNVASAAHDATWQASPQKRRREIDVSVSAIALILAGRADLPRGPAGQDLGRTKIGRFCALPGHWRLPPITESGLNVVIS